MELLERQAGDAGLLLQLATGADIQVFIRLDQAARQGPTSLERRVSSLDEQDFETPTANREDHDVGRHGQGRQAILRHVPPLYCVCRGNGSASGKLGKGLGSPEDPGLCCRQA